MYFRNTLFSSSIALGLMLPAGTALADNYGAIAYSTRSGAWGVSYDYRSRAEAERVALRNCRQHGSGCQVAVWFANACGALAAGNGGAWGTGYAYSRGQAENIALGYCRNYGGGCRVVAWSCTTR